MLLEKWPAARTCWSDLSRMILRSRRGFGWNLNAVQPPPNSSLDAAQFFSRVTISNGTDAGGAKSAWDVSGAARTRENGSALRLNPFNFVFRQSSEMPDMYIKHVLLLACLEGVGVLISKNVAIM
jgi:hypothetical protein